MSIFMTLRIALKALNRNKMRTILTMLGMIIGVGAVITMVALGTRRAGDDRGAGQVGRHQPDQRSMPATSRRAASARAAGHGRRRSTPEDATRCDSVPGVQYVARRRATRAARSSPATRTGRRRSRAPTSTCRSSAAGRRKYGAFFTPQDVNSGREGRRARHGRRRHALRPRRRSDRADHPRPEPAVQGASAS